MASRITSDEIEALVQDRLKSRIKEYRIDISDWFSSLSSFSFSSSISKQKVKKGEDGLRPIGVMLRVIFI